MNTSNTPRVLTLPTPCGIALSSVTSDGRYLYALQPDKKVVYKLDSCGRIICTYKLCRRFTGITYCDGLFYAVCDGDNSRIYTLNTCFREIGSIRPDVYNPFNIPTILSSERLNIGSYGSCASNCCASLAVATLTESFSVSASGSIISRLSSSGRNLFYTAIAVNDGILLEGLESRLSEQSFIRAQDICSGDSKVVRLPAGYKIRSFLCFGGRPYVFITKNSFHGYIAAVCVGKSSSGICGEIIELPGNIDAECCEESCNVRSLFGRSGSCSCASCSCSEGATSNQSAVQSETTENTTECDIDELCRIYNCIKALCESTQSCNCGCNNSCGCHNGCNSCGCNNSCGCGNNNGCHNNSCGCNNNNCGCSGSCGNVGCDCYPSCCCDEGEVNPENCLPLQSCPQNICGNTQCPCNCDCLKVNFDSTDTSSLPDCNGGGSSDSLETLSNMTLGEILRLLSK